ncbi:copper amine oxidase N-terminal domain-containing protein [Clostridium sp. 'deep sea']|uniref:copper amine oxidase N-terminal domain-containing protein n=1 Tax=Clostridium sp. 'deep sea' TaxID=2779445 RepID=UPI001FACF89C|nr:copper amine oxidase N-terminal domain-containing protein [Clostridium sp. 'deep sea']
MFFTLAIILLLAPLANAEEMPKLKVDDCIVLALKSNRNYYIDKDSNRLMIPMSIAMQALNVNYVGYDKETKQRTFRFLGNEIKLAIGCKTAYINGKTHIMDVAPAKFNGVFELMFIPIRVLIDSCDLQVSWNSEWKELCIHDKRIQSPKNYIIYFDGNYPEKDKTTPYFRLISYCLPVNDQNTNIFLSLKNISGKQKHDCKIGYFAKGNFNKKYFEIDTLAENEVINVCCNTEVESLNNYFLSIIVDY